MAVDSQVLAVCSAVVGLLGSVILAFSLDRVLNELGIAISALSTSIESIASAGHVYVFTGLEERIKSADRISRWWIRGGIVCLVLSTGLAVWSLHAAGQEERAKHDAEHAPKVREWI